MLPGVLFDYPNGAEVDSYIGPAFSFDLVPPGGSPYGYEGSVFYVEDGMSLVIHEKTPEPATLGLVATGLVVGGFLRSKRKVHGPFSGNESGPTSAVRAVKRAALGTASGAVPVEGLPQWLAAPDAQREPNFRPPAGRNLL